MNLHATAEHFLIGAKVIISEKQIMQLILIARDYAQELKTTGDQIDRLTSHGVMELIFEISNQQSEELKMIE